MKKIMSMLLVLSMLLMGAAMAETLTMATNAAFPPYEYYDDETGEVTGIDVEIAQAFATSLATSWKWSMWTLTPSCPRAVRQVLLRHGGHDRDRGPSGVRQLLRHLRHRRSGGHRPRGFRHHQH